MTRGATPASIKEGSEWQCGPKWLTKDPSSWPVTQVELSKEERETEKGFEKVTKVFKTASRCLSSIHGPQCQEEGARDPEDGGSGMNLPGGWPATTMRDSTGAWTLWSRTSEKNSGSQDSGGLSQPLTETAASAS